ncbi:DUF805 domain-containing protein [uncultured Stenotrophomonas sp.]|uniref:DUF805 domain-containing protein n=1 Tax=uncultured Stenotrophomonas sp. TaxID=165438 RepID=UPI0025DA2E29|nr:DUF805 domain-containing protein [uncultured Stenotrophomonas sp.]
MDQLILPLKRYAQFEGRANRREYWMFQLFLMLVAVAISLLGGVLAIIMRGNEDALAAIVMGFMGLLGLVWLATLLPLIAVTVRRLHDCNQSGWLYLLALVPGGGLVILVFALLPGTPEENRYGPVPPEFG